MRRSQTSPLLSIKHRWWFWLQPASIVLIWSLQSSSSNPFLDWPSICLNLIIVDKVIAPSLRWDITSFLPQPLHIPMQRPLVNFCTTDSRSFPQLSPETLSSDLAMARGPLRGIGGTGNCLFRASSSWKIVNIITSIDITMMSLSHKKKHLVAFTSTQLYPLIRPTAYWTKQTPQNKVAPCNFLWRSRTCCRGRREGGRSCPWTPPEHRHDYCHHDGHDKDSYDDES